MSADTPSSPNPIPTGTFVPPRSEPQRPLPPRRIILEQPMGGMRKFFTTLLLIALAFSVMFNFGLFGAYKSYLQTAPGIEEKFHSGSLTARDKIAIIELDGTIIQGDGFVKKQIDKVKEDPRVKAVVLRVNSPGGTVTGSDYLYHHLNELRREREIPLVVSMGALAASGGYYVAMSVGETEDTIFAEPATWTGSIGVLIPHYDISGLLEDWRIKDDTISSGPLKRMLSITRPASEETQAVVKTLVDESFERFKEVVASGRPRLARDGELMKQATTGQIFSATQARELGLIDKIGFIEDAIKRAAELAKVDVKEVRVVEFHKPQGLLDAAMGGASAHDGQGQLAFMLDLTAPRAYYLCTWLPALVQSSGE